MLYLREFEDRASGGRKIALLVTAKPILRGSVINEESLATREVPQAYVDERAIRASDRARVVGLRATNNVSVAQTVEWTDVIAPSDGQRDLASLVQPGNRALPLRVEASDTLSLVRPGDFVDIIGVFSGESQVLLQRVLVLATGLDTQAGGNGGTTQKHEMSRIRMLTVSVSVSEGQLLALAMERGRLTAVVRNPDDQRVAETLPGVTDSVLLDAKKRDARRRGPTGPVRLEEEK